MGLRIEHNAVGVVTCWLDNPNKRNALNDDMLTGLTRALTEVSSQSDVRMFVIRGDHGTFCSGRDLGELKSDPNESEQSRMARLTPVQTLYTAFEQCAVPTVAAVQGKAVGLGVAISTWADLAIATESATFSVPEARSGVTPSITAVSLAKKVGYKAALTLSLTGSPMSAQQALRVGLVQFLHPESEFETGLELLCKSILLGGPCSLSQCKKLLKCVQDAPLDKALEQATQVALTSMGQDEAVKGIKAFQDRISPPWVLGLNQDRAS